MLPAIPANFGRLTDVFASALGSVIGVDNRLNFRPAKRVFTVLVDGLGAHNLKAAGGHAPLLNQALAKSKPIACGFPSTTATSITSFGTGLPAGQHGLVGYKLYDRTDGTAFNLLNGWDEVRRPEAWQPHQTVSQRALAAGIGAFFIGPKAYEGSDFTRATMREAKYLPARTISDRFEVAAQLLRTDKSDWIAYLYVPELDQMAHNKGVNSSAWLEALEEVNGAVASLSRHLGKADGLILTADHGVIDVQPHQQIMLDEIAIDWSKVACVAGEPRVNYLYLNDAAAGEEIRTGLQTSLGDKAVVLATDELVAAGLLGPVTPETRARLPELYVLALKNVALYHRGFAPPLSLNMIGQHGGLHPTELTVPLLGFGALG